MTPDISVLIPIYNVAPYLSECLDSVCNQTLSNIEIICIDDGSTDSSSAILDEFANKDKRIIAIHKEKNEGVTLGRKQAVSLATGRYIMFLDSDDYLDKNTCKIALDSIEKHRVDILHFSSDIVSANSNRTEIQENINSFLLPFQKKIIDTEIIRACYGQDRFSFTLWNKIYRADLVKKAFQFLPDARLNYAEDKLSFFLISFFAHSYYGDKTKPIYHYRLGTGISTSDEISVSKFDTISEHSSIVCRCLKDFLVSQNQFEKFEKIYNKFSYELLHNTVYNWVEYLNNSGKTESFPRLIQSWNEGEVIGELAESMHDSLHDFTGWIRPCIQSVSHRKVSCIGIYYHSITIGGAQSVVVQLIQKWIDMGYRCVLFTDEAPSNIDYALPEGVTRVVVPSCMDYIAVNRFPHDFVSSRANAWKELLAKYGIDTVVYHAWTSHLLLWDLLAIKLSRVNFLIHCHSVFSYQVLYDMGGWLDMPGVFALADSVVCLSDSDTAYWKHFNPNCFSVVNPVLKEKFGSAKSDLKNHNLIWVGRFSEEKQPAMALSILKYVLESIPDATLTMVGDDEHNANTMKSLKKKAEDLKIKNHVSFVGFQKDPMPFYCKASVLLCTSRFEGFPLTLLEAKSCGLPVVMFSLPYLTLAKKDTGVLSVPMDDCSSASKAVVNLLCDSDLLKSESEKAIRQANELLNFDFTKCWNSVFLSLSEEHQYTIQNDETVAWNTFLSFMQRRGTQNNATGISAPLPTYCDGMNDDDIVSENTFLHQQIDKIHASFSYKLGRTLTFLPRLLRRILKCYREHGLSYTLKRFRVRRNDWKEGWRPD